MKRAITAGLALACLLLSAGLSGCAMNSVVRDLTPEAKEKLAEKFMDRCGGSVRIAGGGATGQLGGGAHAEFELNGNCPTPGAAPPSATP